MNYISTTDLRLKSSSLIELLKQGVVVSLIHRSELVAVITPKQSEATAIDVATLKNALKQMRPDRLIPKHSREKTYKHSLSKAYG